MSNAKNIIILSIVVGWFALAAPATTYAVNEVDKVNFMNRTKAATVRFEIDASKWDKGPSGISVRRVSSGDLPTGQPGDFPSMSAPSGYSFGHEGEGSYYKVFVKTEKENEFMDSGRKKLHLGSENIKIGTNNYKLSIKRDEDTIYMELRDI